jgi:hypothetical protein
MGMRVTFERLGYACAIAASAIAPRGVSAQTVYLLRGTVSRPPALAESQTVPIGTVISTRGNALVILDYRWPSDLQGFPCERWVIIAGEQDFSVAQEAVEGNCDVSVTGTELDNPGAGTLPLQRVTFYGEPRADGIATPPKALTGIENRRRLQQKLAEIRSAPPSQPGFDATLRRADIYATLAVAQNRANLANHCGFSGGRWNSGYQYHFNWCRSVGAEQCREETRQRQLMLDQCAP